MRLCKWRCEMVGLRDRPALYHLQRVACASAAHRGAHRLRGSTMLFVSRVLTHAAKSVTYGWQLEGFTSVELNSA